MDIGQVLVKSESSKTHMRTVYEAPEERPTYQASNTGLVPLQDALGFVRSLRSRPREEFEKKRFAESQSINSYQKHKSFCYMLDDWSHQMTISGPFEGPWESFW